MGVSTHEFWTSGTKVVNSWFWLGTGAAIDWYNWAAGEPNADATSICIHTGAAGWADDDCFLARYYLSI
ncbi:hypothetical protein B566_EDAN012133 [Ephemera danica]|nr:hypothetical protein B566_EDAN012133 [Ephemera danica]